MQAEREFYDEKFYTEETASSTDAAQKILPLVTNLVDINSVLDVGCGAGMFLKFFLDRGITDIRGLDGDYVPQAYRKIPVANFTAHDLKTPFHLNRKFDLVMTLEVAEHLPDSSADPFVGSLCEHGDVVLFSAAMPGQGGTNHINEQWPNYWAAKFATRNYMAVDCLRPILWHDNAVDYWYRQNTIIFANKAGFERNLKLAEVAVKPPRWNTLDIIHPEMYAKQLGSVRGNEPVLKAVQKFIDDLVRYKSTG